MIAACGVTPQAQKTGTSPSRISTGSPKSGVDRSVMPNASGAPMCTGAPCTAGNRPLIATASATRSAAIGRIDTTIGPLSLPAGRQGRFVRYIDTFDPVVMCRISMPAASIGASNVKLHPISNATMSSVQ